MINSQILSLLKSHNVNEAQGVAYLYSLYINDKNTHWIPDETKNIIKLLGIVSISNGIPEFHYPLFTDKNIKQVKQLKFTNDEIVAYAKTTWLPLWPTGLSNIVGYTVSGNTNECIVSLNKFINDFNNLFNSSYSKTEIFNLITKATKSYLAHRKVENYKFIKKNINFISDGKSSSLEEFVNRCINGETSDIDTLAAIKFTEEM